MIIALGGSIVVPNGGINTEYLKKFKEFIFSFLEEGKRFIIVMGGGAVARQYQNAAAQITSLSDEDKDWLGIHATRLNAHLLRAIFFAVAHPVVIDNPTKNILDIDKYQLFIASGWRPGWSTDYIAVMLAKRFSAKQFICATSVPYVYDADVEKNADAKPILEIFWTDYRKIVGDVWTPGMRAPVDPVAAKFAQEAQVRAIIVLGTDLENLAKVIRKEKFRGSVIK